MPDAPAAPRPLTPRTSVPRTGVDRPGHTWPAVSRADVDRPGAHRLLRGRARYRRIVGFATRFMILEWWFAVVLPRIGLRRLAARGRDERLRRFARQFHDLAVDLGGLMIKVGQFMSTRLDVLPPTITHELDGLQDEVPAERFDDIRAVIEAELGRPVDRAFVEVDPTPLAAASLGQVHRARLTDALARDTGFGEVVVKVQRPGIDEIIDVDLAALRRIAQLASRVRAVRSRVDTRALVDEFATICTTEIDYLNEASWAERFADNFADDPRVRAPRVAWERTTRRVLVLEDVSAIKITDVDALRAAGIDPSEVADELARVSCHQLFVDGFLHGDPHPGNIFVTPVPDAPVPDAPGPDATRDVSWTLTYVDFGMMGEVTPQLRSALTDLLMAIVGRDADGMVAAVQHVGFLLPGARTEDLRRAMTETFDRFGGMAVADLAGVDPREMAEFGQRLGRTLRDLPLQLPEDLLLVARASSLVSGLCTALQADFNIWTALEPFAADLAREQSGGVLTSAGRRAVDTLVTAASLPGRLDALARRAERGDLALRIPDVDRRLGHVERAIERAVRALVFAAMLLAGAWVRTSDPRLGTALMAASVIPLVALLVVSRRR
ncbi:ABC1 kinase family protein [Acidipropionibacterium timonense]|uniref:ABC1 kinase family protein n=1 Tax=Acidipropionibacterium timonense TaxID=2161818 RepID=UPI001FDAB345|nr:AarF/UbiB family protein [Acidipropionibacterium timonense]